MAKGSVRVLRCPRCRHETNESPSHHSRLKPRRFQAKLQPVEMHKAFPDIHTLATSCRGAGKEGAIQAGLEKLAAELLARPWERTDGAALHIERLLIDSGYLPGVCNAVAIKAGPAVLLSKGMGLKAGNKPMASYTRWPGERHGFNWYIPNVSRSSEFRHVAFDANSWKTFVHARLATIAGDHGALTLFGKKPEQHRLFAEHACPGVALAKRGRRRRKLRCHGRLWPKRPRMAGQAVEARQPLARLPRRLRRRGVHGRREGRRREYRRSAAEAIHPGRSAEGIMMSQELTREKWDPTQEKRGLECRYCG